MYPDRRETANQAAGVAGNPATQQAQEMMGGQPQADPNAQAAQMIAQQVQQLQAQIAQIQAEIAQNQGRDLNILNARSQKWVKEIMTRNEEERLRGR